MEKEILINEIKVDNIREFDNEDIKHLADSILYNGLINPVTVKQKEGQYLLICGERRLQAFKHIFSTVHRNDFKYFKDNKMFIPARIVEVEHEDIKYLQLIENIQRKDMNVIDELNVVKDLIRTKTLEQVCVSIGKSKSFVNKLLKLDKLSYESKNLVLSNKLKVSIAYEICILTKEDQETVCNYILSSNSDLTSKDIRSFIIKTISMDLIRSCFDKSEKINDIQSCISCSKRSGAQTYLFKDEIKDKDICFDRLCFKKKTEFALEEIKEKIESCGAEVIKCIDRKTNDKSFDSYEYLFQYNISAEIKDNEFLPDKKYAVVYDSHVKTGKVYEIKEKENLSIKDKVNPNHTKYIEKCTNELAVNFEKKGKKITGTLACVIIRLVLWNMEISKVKQIFRQFNIKIEKEGNIYDYTCITSNNISEFLDYIPKLNIDFETLFAVSVLMHSKDFGVDSFEMNMIKNCAKDYDIDLSKYDDLLK